jgi:flagellar protein FlbT
MPHPPFASARAEAATGKTASAIFAVQIYPEATTREEDFRSAVLQISRMTPGEGEQVGLKVTLEPNERILINGAVLRNWSNKHTMRFVVENKAIILRESDFMTEVEANQSPARRLYWLAMLAMLDSDNEDIHRDHFVSWLREFVGALRNPVAIGAAAEAGQHVHQRNYHRALQGIRHLIDYETNSLRGTADAQPTQAAA